MKSQDDARDSQDDPWQTESDEPTEKKGVEPEDDPWKTAEPWEGWKRK